MENSPRPAIRKSFEVEYVDDQDCEILLEALEWRNNLSHVYRESVAHQAEALIKDRYHPVLVRLHTTLNLKAKR